MKVLRRLIPGILVTLNYWATPQTSFAQPQSMPQGSAPAQSSEAYATGTGVAYPEKISASKTSKGRPPQIKDELPRSVPSQSEKDHLAQLKFTVDPRLQIEKYLQTLKLSKERPILARGSVNYIESDALKSLFPTSVFYVLRFPQWPVAMEPPQPLGNNNIFVISKEAKELTLITDTNKERYKQFLIAKLPRIQSEKKAMQAVKAALVLVKELYQDGMFKFENEANSISFGRTGAATNATGKLNVVPQGGNSGTLSVTIITDVQGAVSDIKHESNLQEGMRPICQSTKLLDPDPIVRKMAEQDILIMGSPAKEYLDWQRTQVSPELRQAIDRIWERIIREGR